MDDEDRVAQQIALRDDYRHVFGSDSGQRVLKDMMRAGHVFQPTFTRGVDGDRESAFREGERNMVLRILAIMRLKTQHLMNLMEDE